MSVGYANTHTHHTHTHTYTHTHTHTHTAAAYSERAMGEYLSACSEMEYTNAGEVMDSVGKLQQEQAKERSMGGPSYERLLGGQPRKRRDYI